MYCIIARYFCPINYSLIVPLVNIFEKRGTFLTWKGQETERLIMDRSIWWLYSVIYTAQYKCILPYSTDISTICTVYFCLLCLHKYRG